MAAQRAGIKADAGCYTNHGWDLVDACNQNKVKLEDVGEDQLPDDLRKLSIAQWKEYVAAKNAERTRIQEQIKQLSAARAEYVAAAEKAAAAKNGNTLDEAMNNAIRTQAERKSFVFAK